MEALIPGLVCLFALLLDRVFGEPKWHPLVVFGNAAIAVERWLNNKLKINGINALLLVCVPPCLIVLLIQLLLESIWLEMAFDITILYLVIGWQSMKQHAMRVFHKLELNDIDGARYDLSMIVSRDTQKMDEKLIVGSTIESVLENGNDCVIASLFWFAVFGPAGAVAHRLVNTLDAMWGYKNSRFLEFGWCAARMDDLMGWVPARLTAIGYGLSGSLASALTGWKAQVGQHKSPNAGLVMASGAGALKIMIGGPVEYDGEIQNKPWLGSGPRAEPQDINRTIGLINRSLLIWMIGYLIILSAILAQS